MNSLPLHLLAMTALLGIVAAPLPVAAGPKAAPRPSLTRTLTGPQSFFATNRHRPRVRFTVGTAASGRLPVSAEFSTQAGYIDRVEIRLDGEVIGTVRPEKAVNAGRLDTEIDLSKIPPGDHRLTLWAWQGREGYRRLHGESKSLKITR